MTGPRIISNIEALKELTAAGLPDLIIIGRRSKSEFEGKRIDPYSITIEKFMELVGSGSNILIDEDDFASDSRTKAPTQGSTKAYIASQLAGGGFTVLDDDTLGGATPSTTQPPSQRAVKVYIDTSNTFVNPSGETTVRNTFGDIKTGITNIDGLTFQEIFENMYFPYALPGFSNFVMSGISRAQEIGTIITQSRSFVWGYNQFSNIDPGANLVTINGTNNALLGLGLFTDRSATSISASLASNMTSSNPGDYFGFRIAGVNTKGASFTRDYNIGFYGRVIWGTHASNVINATDAASLSNSQDDLTINMTTNTGNDIVGSSLNFTPGGAEYSYLLIPAGVQLPNDIRNSTLPGISGSYDMSEGKDGQTNITLTTGTRINVSYHVFRSQNATSGPSTAIISA